MLESSSTTLATSTLNATTACIATREAGALSIRRWERGAPQTRHAAESQCAFLKRPYPRMVRARKFFLCLKTPSFCPCTRLTWPIRIRDCLFINKISKRFAAQATLIKPLAAVLPVLNLRIRAVCACQTWIAPRLIRPFLRSANVGTLRKAPSIAI